MSQKKKEKNTQKEKHLRERSSEKTEKKENWKSLFIWNKKRAAAAIVAAAAILMTALFTASGSGSEGNTMIIAILLGLAGGCFVLLDLRLGRIATVLLYLVLPAAALCALENYTHVITDLAPMILVLNLLFFYLLYGLFVFLTGSAGIGFTIATLVPLFCGLANYFVVSFRGTPIVPWDLLSLGTAASVADNYVFTMSWKACFSVIAFIWIILIASKSTVKFVRRKIARWTAAGVCALLLSLYVGEIQKSSVQAFFGMDTTLFTLNVLYRNNGIAAAFLGNLRFLNIEQPDGYSAEKAEALMAQVQEKRKEKEGLQEKELETEPEKQSEKISEEQKKDVSEDTATVISEQQSENSGIQGTDNDNAYPNIIVIMDEAFSDLSVWGGFDTTEEVLPFFRKLQQEAVGGEVYVSLKGGNTANTEFEFLTGDTMGFLPTGSVPYQQYINGDTPSLASYLKSLGYDTTAIHPYNRSGWDRDTVYEQFGFDEFLDKDAFTNPYRLRGYISDKSAFDKIIEQLSMGKDSRKFIFEVTMQNHGGYSRATPDFSIYLRFQDVANRTTSVEATEKYLTLINQTDRALEELITYLREQEEPTIVLMFGDHQPSDYITNVIQRICSVSTDDSLESLEQGYRVPFVMWSNYGLKHEYYDGISVNYLSTLLMKHAGIPLTGYQSFLEELMGEYPIINGLVYRDADGVFHSYKEKDETGLLNEYQMLQYNHLVDTKHRKDAFFGKGE